METTTQTLFHLGMLKKLLTAALSIIKEGICDSDIYVQQINKYNTVTRYQAYASYTKQLKTTHGLGFALDLIHFGNHNLSLLSSTLF